MRLLCETLQGYSRKSGERKTDLARTVHVSAPRYFYLNQNNL
ncbi:hypothetical protein [Leptospira interrogans]|nr:hypothetical protein [Leptospira interrogans]